MNSLQALDACIDKWFEEDLGDGDHTTLGTIPEEASGSASLLVKENGIIAGVEIAAEIFRRFDGDMKLDLFMDDGTIVSPGDVVFRVSGKVHPILKCERLILNLMQRMSGIATTTRSYVDLLEGTGTKILDTRKTTPGMRLVEKEAVRIGGGTNHRFGLYDMVLIKDNHIDFASGIRPAIERIRSYLDRSGLDLRIEVETRDLEDVKEAMATGGIHRILLDNFSIEMTRQAVELINHRYETESSGGINKDTIRAYAECGVDYISVGALTHQINSMDLSLKADFGERSLLDSLPDEHIQ
jgi:nicotinate-nucleotide pyrophosphorylase (carboxylating)